MWEGPGGADSPCDGGASRGFIGPAAPRRLSIRRWKASAPGWGSRPLLGYIGAADVKQRRRSGGGCIAFAGRAPPAGKCESDAGQRRAHVDGGWSHCASCGLHRGGRRLCARILSPPGSLPVWAGRGVEGWEASLACWRKMPWPAAGAKAQSRCRCVRRSLTLAPAAGKRRARLCRRSTYPMQHLSAP